MNRDSWDGFSEIRSAESAVNKKTSLKKKKAEKEI